jgi:hypothetical protein
MRVVNAVLTAVVDRWSRSWTARCPSRLSAVFKWSAVASRRPGILLKIGRSHVVRGNVPNVPHSCTNGLRSGHSDVDPLRETTF